MWDANSATGVQFPESAKRPRDVDLGQVNFTIAWWWPPPKLAIRYWGGLLHLTYENMTLLLYKGLNENK